MRRVALVPRSNPQDVKRVILHEADYLYLSCSIHDAGSFADEWYASVEDAEAVCESFGIDKGMWQEVPDTRALAGRVDESAGTAASVVQAGVLIFQGRLGYRRLSGAAPETRR